MLANPMLIWALVGIVILIMDKTSGKYNITYAYYSAFTVTALLLLGIMRVPVEGDHDYPYIIYYLIGEVVVFIVGCLIWRFVLRDAAPKSKLGRKSVEFYQNIIGRTAEVSAGGINTVSGGEVILDGTAYAAKLAEGEASSVKAGTKIQIQEVIGDTLVVTVYND